MEHQQARQDDIILRHREIGAPASGGHHRHAGQSRESLTPCPLRNVDCPPGLPPMMRTARYPADATSCHVIAIVVVPRRGRLSSQQKHRCLLRAWLFRGERTNGYNAEPIDHVAESHPVSALSCQAARSSMTRIMTLAHRRGEVGLPPTRQRVGDVGDVA